MSNAAKNFDILATSEHPI